MLLPGTFAFGTFPGMERRAQEKKTENSKLNFKNSFLIETKMAKTKTEQKRLIDN